MQIFIIIKFLIVVSLSIFGTISRTFLFRDLKPENFLLQKVGDIKSIKLIDFGLSQKLSENQLMSTPNGTVRVSIF